MSLRQRLVWLSIALIAIAFVGWPVLTGRLETIAPAGFVDKIKLLQQQNEKQSKAVATAKVHYNEAELQLIIQPYLDNNALRNVTIPAREFLVPESPLFDKTLPWDEDTDTITRLWVDQNSHQSQQFTPPPAMLLLTTQGWNAPNQSEASGVYRGIRMREFMDGVINHPWFHPTAWTDLNQGRMEISNSTRYYVFLDIDTCIDKNYPWYGHGHIDNMDLAGRVYSGTSDLGHIDSVMESRLFHETNGTNALLVVFDCGGWGPSRQFLSRKQRYGSKLRIASLSANQTTLQPHQDMGLPPPAPRQCQLSQSERDAIEACDETNKTLLLSFTGVLRLPTRGELKAHFGDNQYDNVRIFGIQGCPVCRYFNVSDVGVAFHSLAKTTMFSACPQGDNLFSYRFSEVMSCGSIPVVYADDWALPFGSDLLDWEDAAVIIRYENISQSVAILESIPNRTRCAMRRNAMELYDKYMKDGRAVIAGIVDTLEAQFNATHLRT